MIDVKSSWGDYIMKKILTIGTTLLAGLSLAACGNQQSSTSAKSSTTQQTHGKYYFDGTTANLQDVKIKITGVKFYQGDETTNGKNVICFDYTITNKTDKDINALTGWQAVFNAYQDNKNTEGKLEVAPMPSDTSDQILQEQDQSIKKGGSVQCRMAYELDSNKKPVVLKATKGYDGTFLGKKTFEIGKSLNQEKNSNNSESSSKSSDDEKTVSKTDKVSVSTESNRSTNTHQATSDNSNASNSAQKEADDYWNNLSPQDKENWHQWSIAESKANDPYQNGYYNSVSSSSPAQATQPSTTQP